MTNGTIFYSSNNLDSCFAAMMMLGLLNVIDDGNSYKAVPYDRTNEFKCPTEQKICFLLGADMAPIHLSEFIELNPESEIRIGNYQNSEKYNRNITDKITKNLNDELTELNIGDMEISVSSMVFSMFGSHRIFSNVFPNVNKESFVYLMEAVGKYNNYRVMTQEEILLVYNNLNNIRESIVNPNDFTMNATIIGETDVAYAGYVKKLRDILKRNFSKRYYTLGVKYLVTPTVAISEEYANDIIRLISYAYEDVVTYEDTANFRIYRIHSIRNSEWFQKCFKPYDVWSEGNLTYMKTNIPQQDR